VRIQVQELTPGCGEWCACLFDRFGQPIHSEKSTKSADDATAKLEDELKRCVQSLYDSSGCAGSVGIGFMPRKAQIKPDAMWPPDEPSEKGTER
jgi:hypothetical protein